MSYYKILNNMTRDKKNVIKERLLRQIKMQTTGSPADMAGFLGIHERSVKRMISELRDEGYNIVFWHAGNTYVFKRDYNEVTV
jgi:Fe-S oxidoreductase